MLRSFDGSWGVPRMGLTRFFSFGGCFLLGVLLEVAIVGAVVPVAVGVTVVPRDVCFGLWAGFVNSGPRGVLFTVVGLFGVGHCLLFRGRTRSGATNCGQDGLA